MKKLRKIIILLFLVVSMTGCNTLSRKTVYMLNDNIEFTMPKIWQQETSNDNALALSKASANLVMDTYRPADIDGISASELLDKKIEEVMFKMDEYRLVEEYRTTELSDRKIYSKLYAGSKDDIETQYYFSVMELTNASTYVYALYTEKEIYMKYNIDDIQRMLIRMKWNSSEDLALN